MPAEQDAGADSDRRRADGVRMIQTSSRPTCRASHSARTSQSETRITSGRKNAGGSSRYVDRPIMRPPLLADGCRSSRSAGSLRPAPLTPARPTSRSRCHQHDTPNASRSARRPGGHLGWRQSCDGPARVDDPPPGPRVPVDQPSGQRQHPSFLPGRVEANSARASASSQYQPGRAHGRTHATPGRACRPPAKETSSSTAATSVIAP